MQISFKSVQIFLTIHEKHGKCNWETAEIGIRTPLKSYAYFRFVSQTTGI